MKSAKIRLNILNAKEAIINNDNDTVNLFLDYRKAFSISFSKYNITALNVII